MSAEVFDAVWRRYFAPVIEAAKALDRFPELPRGRCTFYCRTCMSANAAIGPDGLCVRCRPRWR